MNQQERIEKLKEILEEPNISGYEWSIGTSILNGWKANLPYKICQLFESEPDESRLLSDEERSQIIQRDTTLWCPTKGEFLDEVGEVVAKAQDQKTARLVAEDIFREIEKQLGIPETKKPFQLSVVLYSNWWQALKTKWLKELSEDSGSRP